MKDRIEIVKGFDKHGAEILKFYVHCDQGRLWLFDKTKTKGVYEYFSGGRSVNELYAYKYKKNNTLNKIVDRLPGYVKYAKQMAAEETAAVISIVYPPEKDDRSFERIIA